MKLRETARRLLGLNAHRQQVAIRYEQAEPAFEDAEVDEEYLEKVREAWSDWQAAQNYFQAVSDPDLVDYAIYELEASRRRYMYMLKQVDKERMASVSQSF